MTIGSAALPPTCFIIRRICRACVRAPRISEAAWVVGAIGRSLSQADDRRL